LVSIDKRTEGTYLVFKDPKTSRPRYEICITPEQLVSAESLRINRKPGAQVYAAMEVIKPETTPDNTINPGILNSEDQSLPIMVDKASSNMFNKILGYGPFPKFNGKGKFHHFDYKVYFYPRYQTSGTDL
jgi:hypothetical protein